MFTGCLFTRQSTQYRQTARCFFAALATSIAGPSVYRNLPSAEEAPKRRALEIRERLEEQVIVGLVTDINLTGDTVELGGPVGTGDDCVFILKTCMGYKSFLWDSLKSEFPINDGGDLGRSACR